MSRYRVSPELSGAPAKCGNGLKYKVLYKTTQQSSENRSDSLNGPAALELAERLESKGWIVRIISI